jgi:hypothetical protein
MPSYRIIKKLFHAQPTLEGAGVHLKRVFAQPEAPLFDPFLLLDDFGSENPEDYLKGFPWHPHRGIETVTYMLEGEVEHGDSLGNKGVIKGGEVQWMTAGSGIIHQEMPKESHPRLKGLQLWVNLPMAHKMTAPRYRGVVADDIPVVRTEGVTVRVIAGTHGGVTGPTHDLVVPVEYFAVDLGPNASFMHTVPSHYTAFVYVFEGSVIIGADTVVEREYAALTNAGDTIRAQGGTAGARCIVVFGEPIGEPVAWGGPIVMNTEAELRQAFVEFRDGTFIKGAL